MLGQTDTSRRWGSMAKVWCAAIECENNKNNQCKAAEINLSEGHIHTVHQGLKQVWECRNYNMSKEAKELKALLDAPKGE